MSHKYTFEAAVELGLPPIEDVCAVFYLDKHPNRLGSLAADICESLASIGAKLHDADVVAWVGMSDDAPDPSWTGDVPFKKAGKHPLGSEQMVSFLRELPEPVASILLESRRRGSQNPLVDSNWCARFESGAPGVRHDLDIITDSLLAITINRLTIEKRLRGDARPLLDALVAAIAEFTDCYYGFIDCYLAWDTCGGSAFANHTFGNYSRDVAVDEANWWLATPDRRERVRRVYWGNFLGPHLAKKFSPRLTEKFERWTFPDVADGSPRHGGQFVVRYNSGAVFLGHSFDPLQDSPYSSAWKPDWNHLRKRAWLHGKFRERDMLA